MAEKLTWQHEAILSAIHRKRSIDLRQRSEAYRQRVIDMAMMEPPLLDIHGDWIFLTDAGRQALRSTSDGADGK